MWLKYDNAPISLASYTDREQEKPDIYGFRSSSEKPRGCWITDESDTCWKTWCQDAGFGLERLTHKHQVVLDESNILILRYSSDILAFTRKFGQRIVWGPIEHVAIAWEKVAEQYDGIIITPYQWCLRLEQEWYYGWDCASGCIWRASAIKEIRLLEVIEVPVKRKQEEELT